MTDEPVVEVTIQSKSTGEEVIELGAGDEISNVFDEATYFKVEVKGFDVSVDGESMIEVGDTTFDQEKTNDDRELQMDKTKCGNCGTRYPSSYSRCEHCGQPN